MRTGRAACRRQLAIADVFARPSALVRLGADLLARYERHPIRVLRAAAVRRCVARLTAELEASAGQGVSPVSALLGCLAQASWLRQHQKPDGGWGEHYTSCLTGRYAEHPDSQAAMTAWALAAASTESG